jgi:hypothetical protein
MIDTPANIQTSVIIDKINKKGKTMIKVLRF